MAVERSVPGTESWHFLHADHLARYFHATGYVSGRRVLDAGTGPGYGAVILNAAGAREVVGIDIDAGTIADAQASYPASSITFLVDDCETLEKTVGPFDVICSFENIEHLRQPEAFVRAAAAKLTVDGVLLCSSPDRLATEPKYINGTSPNPYHEHEWFAEDFKQLLSQGFRDVRLERQVESVACRLRRQAAINLQQQFIGLWRNPFVLLGRACQALVGKRQKWLNLHELGVPSVADYPIVNESIANCVGGPHCLFAICREPIR